MNIPVAGVTEGGDAKLVRLAEIGDRREQLRHAPPRHDDVVIDLQQPGGFQRA